MKKKMLTMVTLFVITALLIAVMPASAQSDTLSFVGCSEDEGEDGIEVGEQLFTLTITFYENNQIGFKFETSVIEGLNGVITQIFFYDGETIDPDPDHVVWEYSHPENIQFIKADGNPFLNPQCMPNPEDYTAFFIAEEAVNPKPHNGIGPGEWAEVRFPLINDKGFDDVIADLNSGALVIGIKGQGLGFGDNVGDSASFITGPPTAITLSCFNATSDRSGAKINWSTGTELNNAGFNLYRSDTPAAPSVKINARLLAAKGETVSGADYSFTDAPGYGTFYYWLEDVELSGRTMLHGPISVTITAPFRQPLFRPALPGSG